jgi:hypothetical protein
MRPTLINHEQVDIVEKIIAGFNESEILTRQIVHLVDEKTGEPILSEETGEQTTIRYGWTPRYVKEAFVTVIDTFLLSEEVHLVCPLKGDAAIIPNYSKLVPSAADFLKAVIHHPTPVSEAIDLRFLEWLDEGENASSLMFVRAYNGQYGDVALRLGPGDFAHFQSQVNEFNLEKGEEERFDDSGVLSSDLIFQAYDALIKEYKIRVGALFRNQTDLILPPLTTAFLDRLPKKPTADTFLECLMDLRSELAPVRRRFAEFQQIDDDPNKSIADAEKVMKAIAADADHFAKKWNQNLTDNTLVQFCIDNLSFLVKLILKTQEVAPEEIAEKVARISPALEKRLRSSAPTILSKYAMETRRMRGLLQLFEKKLGLQLNDHSE